MPLSKTAFMRGMQCPKMLWLDKHKPSAKVIPPQILERLDAGNDFGDRAIVDCPTLKTLGGLLLELFGVHLHLATPKKYRDND